MSRQRNPLASRGEDLRGMTPAFVADIVLFETAQGGRRSPILPGWGCPCKVEADATLAWDAWPVLDEPLNPGESRKAVPFVTLRFEAAEALRKSDQFFLWEGKIIGQAQILSPD